jgi:RNA-directed DNA polymerase
LKTISSIIESRPVHYIVDADIRGFYDHLNHTWLMKFLKHRIADENLLRLIGRFLKSGIIENQEYHPTIEGAPQGGVVSPILANVYLHYVLDLWFSKVVKAHCRGEAHMVRYADDFICCFQYEEDAKRYYRALQNRLGKFGLELADDKTKIIAFGKDSLNVKNEGQIKPGTFDFVGFTHYCGKSKMGRFRVKRKTSKKKYRTSLLKVKKWVKGNRNLPSHDLMDALRVKLNGYFRYYGVTDNFGSLGKFLREVTKLLFNWLNRRSQRKSFTREQFKGFLRKNPLPLPKIYVNVFQLRFPITWCK